MWELTGRSASLTGEFLQGSLDLSRPERGLSAVVLPTSGGRIVEAFELLCVQIDGETLRDVYIRGPDLIATYAESPGQDCSVQLYWRILPYGRSARSLGVLAGLELMLSSQTRRMDADSRRVVVSTTPLGAWNEQRGRLWQAWKEHPFQLSLMADPSNLGAAMVNQRAGRLKASHIFFQGRLEKGVIRRGRLRLAFLRPDASPSALRQLYDEFARSPLPLTT